MSDKRIPATPRKRGEVAKRGYVPRSAELSAALTLLAGFAAVALVIPGALEKTRGLLAIAAGSSDVGAVLKYALPAFLGIAGAPELAALLAGIAAHFITGGRVITFRLNWPNPAAGLARMFSRKAAFEILKGLLKVGAVGAVAFCELKKLLPLIMYAPEAAGKLAFAFLAKVGLVAAAVAVIDFAFQRWDYERSIAMTPEEVKEETKETEGSPEVKRKLRQWMRKIAAARASLKNVKKATVVLTNPTKYAVGLMYEKEKTPAPVVVAKGSGKLAEKIRREALRLGVPVVQEPPLARALFKLDVGKSIPPALYRAVAEVLVRIYRAAERGVRV